jgi:predicted ATPase
VEALLLDEERFKECARYIFAVGRYYALANEMQRAREYIKRAIGVDVSMSENLINDPSLGVIWRDFKGNE